MDCQFVFKGECTLKYDCVCVDKNGFVRCFGCEVM